MTYGSAIAMANTVTEVGSNSFLATSIQYSVTAAREHDSGRFAVSNFLNNSCGSGFTATVRAYKISTAFERPCSTVRRVRSLLAVIRRA